MANDGAQVTFTVFGRPGVPSGDAAADADAVGAALGRLLAILEAG